MQNAPIRGFGSTPDKREVGSGGGDPVLGTPTGTPNSPKLVESRERSREQPPPNHLTRSNLDYLDSTLRIYYDRSFNP